MGNLGWGSGILRFDASQRIIDSTAYVTFDVSNVDGLGARGFHGCVTDNQRFVYFSPYATNNTVPSGKALRYDSSMNFENLAAWSAFDMNGLNGLTVVGMRKGAFDGKYIYYTVRTKREIER